MAVKVEWFGAAKDKSEDRISIFFKTPKRIIYQLMFMRHYEYVSAPNNIDVSKYSEFKIKTNVHFYGTYMKKTNQYNIRFFKYDIRRYPCDNFKDFFTQYLNDEQIKIELYEFLFSDTYKYLTNEENIICKNICSVRTKQLYKYLQKGICDELSME